MKNKLSANTGFHKENWLNELHIKFQMNPGSHMYTFPHIEVNELVVLKNPSVEIHE